MSDGYVGIPIEVHKKESVELGRREERAAIVAWLREQLSCSEEWESANEWVLGCIERGEHLRGDDE